MQLFKLGDKFFLSWVEQLFKENTETFVKAEILKMESGRDEIVLSIIR